MWTDGHTRRGCYWRLLDNKVFGYDCHAADDCTCEPELKQIRETETEKQERDTNIRGAISETKPDPRMTTPPQEDR